MFIRIPEAHSRSLAKAVSWRLVGGIDTFVIVWLATGQMKCAGVVFGVETVTKIVVYYVHERVWGWLLWRRSESPAERIRPAARVARADAAPSV